MNWLLIAVLLSVTSVAQTPKPVKTGPRTENAKCSLLLFREQQSPSLDAPGFSMVTRGAINGKTDGSNCEKFSCVRRSENWHVLSCPTVTGLSANIPVR